MTILTVTLVVCLTTISIFSFCLSVNEADLKKRRWKLAVGIAAILLGFVVWVVDRINQTRSGQAAAQKVNDVQQSVDANTDTLARLEQSAQRIEAFLAPKELGEDPRERKLPPELLEQARELLDRGNREQQALAKIALGQHDEADSIIQELKRQPLADAFRLLTLEGNNWYNAGQFDRAIEPYEQALRLRPNDPRALNSAAIAHVQAQLGSIETHQCRAIEVPKRAIAFTDGTDRLAWAGAQQNLGVAWSRMPTGDRAENLHKAIAAYEAALEVWTHEEYRFDWAGTHNNLGGAWRIMPTGDRAENLHKAIAAYEAALEVYRRDAHPVAWAMTQHNLGAAWQEMPTGDPAENLRKAIAAYEAALEVFTRDAHPVDWAGMQNDLGNVWSDMPTGDRAENLHRAIAAYEAALEVSTRDAHPVDWATTQNNLGNAWSDMPTGDRAENLQKAIAAYEAALEVYRRDAHPVEWAMTHYNLANALADMAEVAGERRCAWLRRAIASGKAALIVRTPEAFPREHEATSENLAIDRQAYEAAGCADEVPFDEIEPAE